MIEFKLNHSLLSLRDDIAPGLEITNAKAYITYTTGNHKQKVIYLSFDNIISEEAISDLHGNGKQLIIRNDDNSQAVSLEYRLKTYKQPPFALVKLSITNVGHEPLYLHEFCLLEATRTVGRAKLTEQDDNDRRFFKVGWNGWAYTGLCSPRDTNSRLLSNIVAGTSYTNPGTPRDYAPGQFWSEGWGILASPRNALIAGFVSTAHQFGQVFVDIRPGRAGFKLSTQADGIRLDPGEVSESEWGYIQFILLPRTDPASDYVGAVARQMNARVPTPPPPAMWTHWYRFYSEINDQLFLENVEMIASQKQSFPCEVAELDDGYQSAWGDWKKTNHKFPNGLADLAGKVRESGMTPGLWLAPFTAEMKSDLVRDHPQWLLKTKRGNPVLFLYDKIFYVLDTSHPAVLEHLRSSMDTIAHQWGFGMIKADFLNTGAIPGKRYNPKVTRAESLRMGLEAIRQGAGGETFLLASGSPFGPAIGIVDSMRIGPDTAPSWKPYFHFAPWAAPIIKHETSMPALRNALRHTLNLYMLNQHWWWNDPDCLLARDTHTHLTEAEVQSAISLIGLSGGRLVTSDDFRDLDPERLRWINLLVPNLGLRGRSLDFLTHEMPEIFLVKLGDGSHAWQLVGLFNWKDSARKCVLRVSDLGYENGTVLDVFDFWEKCYSRIASNELVFEMVPSHGVKLLRIGKANMESRIVGDTLHISQGGELKSSKIVDGIMQIESRDLGRWAFGELFFWMPKAPQFSICNGEKLEAISEGNNIYLLKVCFVGKGSIEIGL